MNRCESPIDLGELAAYRAGELDEERERTVEDHYFSCAACAERLAWVESLADAVAECVRSGTVSSAVSSAWIARAEAQHVHLRTYALSPGGSVDCTAAPTDDFVVVRLGLDKPLGDRVDVHTEFTDLVTGQTDQRVTEDLPVDAKSGEVLYAFSGAQVRLYPKSRWVMHVRSHGETAAPVGPYTMNHTPWTELQGDASRS